MKIHIRKVQLKKRQTLTSNTTPIQIYENHFALLETEHESPDNAIIQVYKNEIVNSKFAGIKISRAEQGNICGNTFDLPSGVTEAEVS